MPDPFTILLVEDDASVRQAVQQALTDQGYVITTAADGKQAMDMFAAGTDLVIADLVMPNIDGRTLLRWIVQHHPDTGVILMTGFGTIPQAVDAIKAGAIAYLTKPLDPEELLHHVRRALEDKRLRQELQRLRGQLREGWHYRHIIGRGPSMQQVFSIIDRAAAVKTTVLLIGESGTGKEMVARALHEAGPRRGGPFLAINCGAIPEALIESTLFGHERGAFTGADRAARGYFRDADGGTLLLDEIGELPLGMQSKLLRVLEDGSVTPVGTTAPHKVDVRIIAATNRDLEEQVREGDFRQDLFYRLNVVRIDLPPLRSRPEDLPILTRYFLDEICRQNNFAPREIEPSLLEALKGYSWPGNVRELRNLLESLVVLSGNHALSADDLPPRFLHSTGPGHGSEGAPVPAENFDLNLTRLSKQMIQRALEMCHGNRTEAARQLGISRRTLHRKLHEFDIK